MTTDPPAVLPGNTRNWSHLNPVPAGFPERI